jgi:DNA-binding transcriptional LysR family regulator
MRSDLNIAAHYCRRGTNTGTISRRSAAPLTLSAHCQPPFWQAFAEAAGLPEFRCHERSPTIPRIGRLIAAFLPDLEVKPVVNKIGVSAPEEDNMDRLTEMEAFATVVDQGGFTDAAKKMGISKSAVSKHVSALEARLGARLLNRTTRRVSPTEIGLAYYDRARRVLNDAGEADALVTSMQSAPSGLLRVSVATDFGVNLLSPILGDFLLEYPDITVNMVLNNRYVELISEGFDMAIRVGELEDSTLRARKLTETTKRMIGAPSYFQKFGRPQKIDDLNDHKLLHYSNQANGNVWKITAPSGEKRQVRSVGWLTVNDGQSLLNAAISGLGIAYLPSFLYADAMRQGLVEEAIPGLPVEVLGIYAVYPPGRFTQPKVRAFIDFLARRYADKGPDNW